MSTESDGPKPTAKQSDDKKKPEAAKDSAKEADKTKDKAPAAGPPPALDERKLKYAELLPHASAFNAGELLGMLQDGRGVVRANAALALAAGNHAAPELVPLIRDSEVSVALAVAEALAKLGPLIRPLIPQIVAALDGAKPEVLDAILTTLGELVGKADDELTAALDIPQDLAMKSVVEAARRAGKSGVAMLAKATHHERSRIRVNAAGGLGHLGKTDPDTALAALNALEQGDPVPDIRTAAKQAILEVVKREKVEVVDALPKNIPDFEVRKLTLSELSEYADQIDIDQMIHALQDGRDHVRVNGARGLAAKGAKGARGATALGLLMRDSVAAVRREAAKAVGKLGAEAVTAAPDLVGALGDVESDVVDAATDTLSAFGERAMDALVKGLEAGGEEHGRRVAELITRSPRATDILTEAFGSPAVNVQVNAAAGLGMLGKDKVGKGLAALHGARTGGDVRTRAAVRAALDIIEAKGDTGPKEVSIAGGIL